MYKTLGTPQPFFWELPERGNGRQSIVDLEESLLLLWLLVFVTQDVVKGGSRWFRRRRLLLGAMSVTKRGQVADRLASRAKHDTGRSPSEGATPLSKGARGLERHRLKTKGNTGSPGLVGSASAWRVCSGSQGRLGATHRRGRSVQSAERWGRGGNKVVAVQEHGARRLER